ncbi:hypothetical protein K438DRAFT_1764644 [Mycena galopus ATCC 62051]|nr:hypothetical protein K438DRAFT_1764644 [Mycena galopus ATCC 62051]
MAHRHRALLGSLAMSVLLVTSAFAQSIVVGAPSPGTNIPLSTSNLTVQIERHNSLSSSKEVSVAIGFTVCDAIEGCGPSAQVLYNGPYTPTLRTPTLPGQLSNYQNFTFPSPFSAPGPVQLPIVHFFDVGTLSADFNIVGSEARTFIT